MALDSAGLSLAIAATISNTLDLSVKASAPLAYNKALSFTSGAGANQIDRVFTDQRTIAASGTDDLDLAGVLVDALGATITLARVKLIAVYAASANANNVVIGGGTNPVTTIMGGTTPTTIVRPGGLWLVTAPDATGYAVTAATADILRLGNSGAGTSVTYDIIIMGSST
jgi:hypothetical protein